MSPPGGYSPDEEARLVAMYALLPRLGAVKVVLRFDSGDDPEGHPDHVTVWNACAQFRGGKHDGAWEVAAALDPLSAVTRLCETLIDGGKCVKCGRITSFVPEPGAAGPMDAFACTFTWQPEEKAYVRTCERAKRN